MIEPLRIALFRRIWLGSLFSNLGLLIQSVAAAWVMTELSASATLVASMQSAGTLPIMVLGIPAGAFADTHDRRWMALVALGISLAGAIGVAGVYHAGLATPALLLFFALLAGTGNAAFGPAWQSSVRELVPPRILAGALSMNAVSYNIARGVGPAIGGLIVASTGAGAAFIVAAVLYLPLIASIWAWQRPSTAPAERASFLGTISTGLAFVARMPGPRLYLLRGIAFTLAGVSLMSLAPLVARDLLRQGASAYGLLLSMFGIGAVAGAISVARALRSRHQEAMFRACLLALAGSAFAVTIVDSLPVALVMFLVSGCAWMLGIALCNISLQLISPNEMAGRSVAIFQSATAFGMALGSWLWGVTADLAGLEQAFRLAALCLILMAVAGPRLR